MPRGRPAEAKADAALRYAARGWSVVALHHTDDSSRCSCGKPDCAAPGKHPRIDTPLQPAGLTGATRDPVRLSALWRAWPYANVGVLTGRASGIVVVDVDTKRGQVGADSLRALEDTHEPLPATLTSLTPTGGWHLFFRHPGGRVSDSTSVIGRHIDVRGDGGYVVAPPSAIASVRYRWQRARAPVAAAPRWLIERIAV